MVKKLTRNDIEDQRAAPSMEMTHSSNVSRSRENAAPEEEAFEAPAPVNAKTAAPFQKKRESKGQHKEQQRQAQADAGSLAGRGSVVSKISNATGAT